MSQRQIHIGKQLLQHNQTEVSGQYVKIEGEDFYQIANYDQMKDFFISVVSDSNHWMFISTRGGLTAGRINAQRWITVYRQSHYCIGHQWR
jgi:hypothetical protein